MHTLALITIIIMYASMAHPLAGAILKKRRDNPNPFKRNQDRKEEERSQRAKKCDYWTIVPSKGGEEERQAK